MRVAVLSDIHGNAPALEAVLDEVRTASVDLIVFGGDVAAGPLPRETLGIVTHLSPRARFVSGNADRYLVECFDGSRASAEPPALNDEWVAARINDRDRDFLAKFESTVTLSLDRSNDTLFCHGSPRGDEEIITALTPAERLEPMLAGIRQELIVCGHTHSQFDRSVRDRRVINPGSVGLPYEDASGAYWAVIGPEVEFRRTSYDLEEAARRIRDAGWPGADDFVEKNLFNSPSANEAAEYFERLATEQQPGA